MACHEACSPLRADIHALELVSGHRRAVESNGTCRRSTGINVRAPSYFLVRSSSGASGSYSYARAYRAVLIEAGHLCQTFFLVATWLGLAPFCSMALADSPIEKDLGLDGICESVLYAAGVGVPARGRRSSHEAGGSSRAGRSRECAAETDT